MTNIILPAISLLGWNMNLSQLIAPILVVAAIGVFFVWYFKWQEPARGTTEWIKRGVQPVKKFRFEFKLHKLTKKDILPLAVIMVLITFVSFYKLGDTTAPLTYQHFDNAYDSVTIQLPESSAVTKVMYFSGGIPGPSSGDLQGGFALSYSLDGVNYTDVEPASTHSDPMPLSYADTFKWLTADNCTFIATYVKITAKTSDMRLGEVVFFSGDIVIPATSVTGANLVDEADTVPAEQTYMNSMYFDEIYHGRAAAEIIEGHSIYETVHPPLGKTIISLGVRIFGMTPFGWRFFGTLFGVLMVAVMYVLLKNMFGKTKVAVCGTLLLCFDFMRYTQTRIATVDSYPTFFILLSFLLMYRYLAADRSKRLGVRLIPLMLSGVVWGIGVASKWTVIYAGVGLALLFFIKLVMDYKYYYQGTKESYAGTCVKTLLTAFAFFVAVPVIIYILAFIPYGHNFTIYDQATWNNWHKTAQLPAWACGEKWETLTLTVKNGMLWDKRYYQYIIQYNVGMYDYHAKLGAFNADGSPLHPYQSAWYQWIFDTKPTLYYWRQTDAGRSVITAFTNPVITWAGLVGLFALGYNVATKKSATALIILVGYLSQIVPWMLVERCVFAYHYFPSLIFLVITLTYLFDDFFERDLARGSKTGRWFVYGFTALTGVVFIMFYPVLSGTPVNPKYIDYVLKWLPDWVL